MSSVTSATERAVPNTLPRIMSGVSIDLVVVMNATGDGSKCGEDGTSIAIDLMLVHTEASVDGMLLHACTEVVNMFEGGDAKVVNNAPACVDIDLCIGETILALMLVLCLSHSKAKLGSLACSRTEEFAGLCTLPLVARVNAWAFPEPSRSCALTTVVAVSSAVSR